MGCLSQGVRGILSFFIREQLKCHFCIIKPGQHATVIVTGKTLGLELALVAFLIRDFGGNIIDIN
jgi:hypothetical protein